MGNAESGGKRTFRKESFANLRKESMTQAAHEDDFDSVEHLAELSDAVEFAAQDLRGKLFKLQRRDRDLTELRSRMNSSKALRLVGADSILKAEDAAAAAEYRFQVAKAAFDASWHQLYELQHHRMDGEMPAVARIWPEPGERPSHAWIKKNRSLLCGRDADTCLERYLIDRLQKKPSRALQRFDSDASSSFDGSLSNTLSSSTPPPYRRNLALGTDVTVEANPFEPFIFEEEISPVAHAKSLRLFIGGDTSIPIHI